MGSKCLGFHFRKRLTEQPRKIMAETIPGKDYNCNQSFLNFYCSNCNHFLIFLCREHAPSIIFMDEIDSIGSARMESGSGNGDSEVQRTMLELLNQLDGFEASNKIKVQSINSICEGWKI